MAANLGAAQKRRIKRYFARVYGDKCFYCGRMARITIDHFMPVSKGGKNELANLRPACFDCNATKRNLLPNQFRVVNLNRSTPLGFRIGHQCGNLFCCE